MIDKKGGSEVCFVPKFQGHASLGKKREPNLYNVAMFTFCATILLMSVRA
jgi:hypothetical protein